MKEDTKGVSPTFSGLRAASNISQQFLFFFWQKLKYRFMSYVLILTVNKNIKKLKFLCRVLDGRIIRNKCFNFSSRLYMQKKTDRNQIIKFLCLVVTVSNDTYDKFNLGLQAFEVFETFQQSWPGLRPTKCQGWKRTNSEVTQLDKHYVLSIRWGTEHNCIAWLWFLQDSHSWKTLEKFGPTMVPRPINPL